MALSSQLAKVRPRANRDQLRHQTDSASVPPGDLDYVDGDRAELFLSEWIRDATPVVIGTASSLAVSRREQLSASASSDVRP